jgi:Raf kinase inhibitor-like YbhB/YbcL family protein
MAIVVESSIFLNDEAIPARYTGDGEDISPPLRWSGLPPGTREVALICDDPDAPRAEPWVHWVLYGLSPEVLALPEDLPRKESLGFPAGARQGRNDFGSTGYGGPAPPPGHGVHHYHFRVYALDAPADVAPGATKAELLAAMDGHVLDVGELVGTYRR